MSDEKTWTFSRRTRKVRFLHPDGGEKDFTLSDPVIYMDTQSKYKILNTEIYIDLPSMLTLSDTFYDVYTLVKITEGLHSLIPMDSTALDNFEKKRYNPVYTGTKMVGEGSFSLVSYSQPQEMVIKRSNNFGSSIPSDVIKEIAFYRTLEAINPGITPRLKAFSFNMKKNTISPVLAFDVGERTFEDNIINLRKEIKISNQKQYQNNLDKNIRLIYSLILDLYQVSNLGLIHCDLKPSNLIIDRNNKLRIIDWGISEVDPSIGFSRLKDSLKQTDMYASPEILVGKELYDYKIDVFSVGIMLMELYAFNTVRRPIDFRDERINWILEVLLGLDLSDLDNINPSAILSEKVEGASKKQVIAQKLIDLGIPSSFSDLIGGMLDINPFHRSDWKTILTHPAFGSVRESKSFITESLPEPFPNDMPIIPDVTVYYGIGARELIIDYLLKASKEITHDSPFVICQAIQLSDLFTMNYGIPEDLYNFSIACFLIAHVLFDSGLNELYPNWLEQEHKTNSKLLLKYQIEIIDGLNGNLLAPSFYTYFSRIYGYHEVCNSAQSHLYIEKPLPVDIRVVYEDLLDDLASVYRNPDVYSLPLKTRVEIEMEKNELKTLCNVDLLVPFGEFRDFSRREFFETFSRVKPEKRGKGVITVFTPN